MERTAVAAVFVTEAVEGAIGTGEEWVEVVAYRQADIGIQVDVAVVCGSTGGPYFHVFVKIDVGYNVAENKFLQLRVVFVALHLVDERHGGHGHDAY